MGKNCQFSKDIKVDFKYDTVRTVISAAALSHLSLANSSKTAPIRVLSIIGAAAIPPIVWLRLLLLLMISQNGCGYNTRAAPIRVRH